MATTKNAAPAAAPKANKFADFVEETVSFPPYWQAEEGKEFFGTLVEKDATNPDFIRYVFVNLDADGLECARGNEKNGTLEPVIVGMEEQFSVSNYGGLSKVLDEYLDLPFAVPLRVQAVKVVPVASSPGHTFWIFKASVPRDIKAKLMAHRREHRQLAAAGPERSLDT